MVGFEALEILPVIYLFLHFSFIHIYILVYVISVILKTGCFWDICRMPLWLWSSLNIWGGAASLAIYAKWLYSLWLGMALQVNGVLPILPLLFPVLWILATAFGEARVLAQMSKASPTSLVGILTIKSGGRMDWAKKKKRNGNSLTSFNIERGRSYAPSFPFPAFSLSFFGIGGIPEGAVKGIKGQNWNWFGLWAWTKWELFRGSDRPFAGCNSQLFCFQTSVEGSW